LKRTLLLLTLLFALISPQAGHAAADTPQDHFLTLYSAFHEAIGFERGVRASTLPDKRVSLATVRKQYLDTAAKVSAFQKDHPGWESVIVNDLEEKIQSRLADLDTEEEASAIQYAPIAIEFHQAEQLEKDGAAATVLKQYQDVAFRLDEFRKSHPNWDPELVDCRARQVQEKIGQWDPAAETPLRDLETAATDYAAAYDLFTDAARSEKDGSYASARKDYQEIDVRLAAFKAAHPNWSPDLVDSRLRESHDRLAAIANKTDVVAAPPTPISAAPSVPATVQATAPAAAH